MKKRDEVSSFKSDDLSIEIANQILNLDIWDYNYFHVFMGVDKLKEINTSFIISILQGRDKNIIIPKVISDEHLDHYLLTDSTKLKLNRWNILEPISGIKIKPKKIQVVFIPLLAYDLYGDKNLYWVFAQRNMDIIKDPVYDMEPGVEIFIPQGESLFRVLGL